jgi:chromosome segregation ATPase
VPNWSWLVSLGLGLLGEAGLVYSSLTDPETGRRVVANLLRSEFHPERLRDKRLQEQSNEALDYRGRIEAAIREKQDTVLKDNLSETARQIDEWLENIFNLAQRLDKYQEDRRIFDRDHKRGVERLAQLQKQLTEEKDQAVKGQIEVNIRGLERQIGTIESLHSTMGRARLQLENTLSALGTLYSQTMLVGARDIDSGRARRLRQEIAEEVEELNDVLLAMDELYATQ